MTVSLYEDFWHLDKNGLKKHSSVIYGAWRTGSPQRQTKRELRRQKLKELGKKTSSKPEGFG